MTSEEQLAWGSHMPALLACIGATTGPVLEIGCGHFSTPALYALCFAAGREFVSIEQDLEWAKKFRGVTHTDSYEHTLNALARHRWSVVFIDHSPGHGKRVEAFKQFMPVSEFVVVHDYHLDSEETISPLIQPLSVFHHVTRTYQPPTLVASLTHATPNSILHL
jgi:hypothetical protein